MNSRETTSTLADYIAVLQRRRAYFLVIIPAALLAAVYIAFSLPAVYRSTSTILLEPSSVPAQMVQTTVASYADQQIEILQRRLLQPDRLEMLVRELDPYPEMPDLTPLDKARQIIIDTSIERVDPITLDVLRTSNAFSIHYHNADPQRAAQVVQRIADMFLDYNRIARSERASDTYQFMLTQAQDIEVRMREAEQKIAQLKARYGDALPESQARNISTIERMDRELRDTESRIRAAEERQATLEVQLSRISPSLSGTSGNWRADLATLQAQLAEARTRYLPDHPDVKRLQRQIESLSARANAQSGGTGVVADNPDYLAVQSQLDGARREVAALRGEAARARGQIAGAQSRLSVAPGIEREYVELSRVRDVLLAQYKDVQQKLRDADVARNLESESMGARFAQIRAPNVPSRPYEPNRLGIILMGFVLGCGLAFGLATLVESIDPTVRNLRDIQLATDIPTLSAVPVVMTQAEQRRQQVMRNSYLAVLVVATLLVALSIVVD